MISVDKKRIVITCDQFTLNELDSVCDCFGLSYSQLISLFADYLHYIDCSKLSIDTDVVYNQFITFNQFITIRYSKHTNQ